MMIKLNELENIIIDEIRKIPKLPLSFLLSGGLDSSLILAFLRKIYPDLPIATFVLANTNEHPDLINAREIAKLFSTIHTEIVLSDNDVVKFSNEFNKIKKSDLKGDMNWFILFSYAKSFSNVIVTGDGGDECFGGYWLHKYPLGHKETGNIKVFSEIHSAPREHLSEMFNMGFRDFLFKEKSQKEDYKAVWEYYIKTIYSKQIDPLLYIANNLGVKIYSPLFSDKIVEFMRGLSYKERIDKKIEKELALKYLPESVVHRKKLALNVALNYN